MSLSIVMPALNEELRIGQSLDRVLAQPGIDEVIVVDGGSSDRTREIAAARSVVVLDSKRGRGTQLNHGAAAAGGDVLLFLHVDVELPARTAAIVQHILADATVVAGAFRTWTVADENAARILGPLLRLADVRSRYSHLPYGDQALFVRTDVFHAAGGYPDQPLMEDLVLSRALRKFGHIRVARECVRVSGRRFQSAPIRQTFWVNVIPALYALGVPPDILARLYGDPR